MSASQFPNNHSSGRSGIRVVMLYASNSSRDKMEMAARVTLAQPVMRTFIPTTVQICHLIVFCLREFFCRARDAKCGSLLGFRARVGNQQVLLTITVKLQT